VTQERRRLVLGRCQAELVQVVFVESVVDEPSLIDHNMRQTFASSPDYLREGVPAGSQSPPADQERLREQFRLKEEFFARQLEPFSQQELNQGLPLVRVYNLGRRVEVHNIRSYLPCRVVFFLMNLHTFTRPILLARAATTDIQHGEFLSREGEAFSHALAEFVAERYGESADLTIWTSTARRAALTCQYVARQKIKLRQLDELDLGDLEGMTVHEIAARLPEEYAALKAQPLQYRFPRGESFADLIQRLEPLVFEIERLTHPLLIVSHHHVLQSIYTYLTDRPPSHAPFIEIPANTVLELTPLAFRCNETSHELVKPQSVPASNSGAEA
jgi:broad specificity phosphatase PhoE